MIDSAIEIIVSGLLLLSPSLPGTGEVGELVAADTASAEDPRAFWGQVDCAEHPPALTPGHQLIERGGDPHPMAGGTPQGDGGFRRLSVYDGDDVYGERCELGLNDRESGPTVFYEEGDRYSTHISLRLPGELEIDSPGWRTVMQMKQAQPYDNPDPASIFELQVLSGRWLVLSDWRYIWDAPARTDVWTRFTFEVAYSADPELGLVRVLADLNGDGDHQDDVDGDGKQDERSSRVQLATLRAETAGDSEDGIDAGEPIPSHLRAGIYQDPGYRCPRSGLGCSVDVDNVQVVDRR